MRTKSYQQRRSAADVPPTKGAPSSSKLGDPDAWAANFLAALDEPYRSALIEACATTKTMASMLPNHGQSLGGPRRTGTGQIEFHTMRPADARLLRGG